MIQIVGETWLSQAKQRLARDEPESEVTRVQIACEFRLYQAELRLKAESELRTELNLSKAELNLS